MTRPLVASLALYHAFNVQALLINVLLAQSIDHFRVVSAGTATSQTAYNVTGVLIGVPLALMMPRIA
jgi:hypothetical protein